MIETVNQKVTAVHILCPYCGAVVDTLDTSREHRPEVTLQMTCNSCCEDFEVTVDTRSGGTTSDSKLLLVIGGMYWKMRIAPLIGLI